MEQPMAMVQLLGKIKLKVLKGILYIKILGEVLIAINSQLLRLKLMKIFIMIFGLINRQIQNIGFLKKIIKPVCGCPF